MNIPELSKLALIKSENYGFETNYTHSVGNYTDSLTFLGCSGTESRSVGHYVAGRTSECFFDVVEWASGKRGLLGISYYAGMSLVC